MDVYGLLCCICILVCPATGQELPTLDEAVKSAGSMAGNAAGAASDFINGADIQSGLDAAKDMAGKASDTMSNIDVGDLVNKAGEHLSNAGDVVGDLTDK